jgi:uncharacterized protein YciI
MWSIHSGKNNMHFVVIAYDYTDPDALNRRMAAREAHIALSDKEVIEGRQVVAAAMLDDDGKMIGSVMIIDQPSRADVDAWLAVEPYMTGRVWERVEVRPCKIGPSFTSLLK